MLCSLALHSQCWEVVVYQEMIYILALGQKYGTCNYVGERQNLLTRKTKAVKVPGCVLIKLLYGWGFCLKLHREEAAVNDFQVKTSLLNLQRSIDKVQKSWVTSVSPFLLRPFLVWGGFEQGGLARLGFWLRGRRLHVCLICTSRPEVCDAVICR